ncbi:hypothetical protein CIHG_04681 [Coccidioides immitis H538.4]|uniref:Uncharacterized protein n=3 Tax=Coccidioides immitis TaxID=5501 RepID=A0A0J8QIX5_COCIT|nr:hypothetical protein CIRG_08103 [Coccidioides immitis RMSCC 2394]KMU72324.1 hypothetical protein CISG_02972 [Coccidioides immitis RMSCC 3703]KMU87237.1 hypothetical protein CIHG_04681 [Coccidioides immitis H538.4]
MAVVRDTYQGVDGHCEGKRKSPVSVSLSLGAGPSHRPGKKGPRAQNYTGYCFAWRNVFDSSGHKCSELTAKKSHRAQQDPLVDPQIAVSAPSTKARSKRSGFLALGMIDVNVVVEAMLLKVPKFKLLYQADRDNIFCALWKIDHGGGFPHS